MARKETVTVEFTDDLDGGKAEGTVSFSYDGKAYEIDLSKKNKSAFDKVLKPYITAARPVRGARGSSRTSSRSSKRTDLAEIRDWAKSNGYEVSDRGRIPAAVIEAFDAK